MQPVLDSWLPAPDDLRLAPGEVHLWRLELDLPAAQQTVLSAALTSDERSRVARFRTPELRQRAAAARGWLRQLLARYLDQDPAGISLAANPWGKPYLVSAAPGFRSEHPLNFNLSHSAGLGLLAVCLDARLGVDLEFPHPRVDTESLWQRYFSPGEQAALAALPLDLRPRAFYAVWTRKEAYLKAIGRGLSLPLDSFSVSVQPDEAARLLQAEDEDPAAWTLQNLRPAPDCPGCVAVNLAAPRWRTWQA